MYEILDKQKSERVILRFMYSIDIDDQESLNSIKNINSDIDNFWDLIRS